MIPTTLIFVLYTHGEDCYLTQKTQVPYQLREGDAVYLHAPGQSPVDLQVMNTTYNVVTARLDVYCRSHREKTKQAYDATKAHLLSLGFKAEERTSA